MKMSDIAKVAGVSPGTVSNALNNREGVSPEKREEIIRIAREMGYYKDLQNKNKQSDTIRFIICKRHGHVVSDTPFFSALIEGIERECRQQGYELLISHINLGPNTSEDMMQIVKQLNLAGMLVLATELLDEDLVLFREFNIPIVFVDNYFKRENCDAALINNSKGAYDAVSYLIENGHREIGVLGSSAYINNFYYRKKGYFEALRDNNLESDPNQCFDIEPTLEGAYKDMLRLLEDGSCNLPTAFLALNDIIALGAMRAMVEKGIKIPEDISVIGFDDMPFCEVSYPRLTTIRVFKQEIGKTAVRRLVEKINGISAGCQTIKIGTELIIRDSVQMKKSLNC